jgi:protein-tyrosine phosphatase
VYLYWPILDGPLPEEDTIRTIARFVSGLMDRGYQVLVHCRAGKNRASLVAGSALIERGFEPEAAVDLLRERRAIDVLSNVTFLEWLMNERPAD